MTRLIAGEFRKLLSTRLWLWLLLAALGVTALDASLDIAFANTPGTFTLPLSTPQGQRTLLAVGAGGSPLAAVLAAIGLTGEYRHRTATATFLATPRRDRVVAAKLIAYAAAGIGYAVACTALTAAIAVPWLAAQHIHRAVGISGIAATLAGVTAAVALFGLLGVGLGALLRDQVATVVVLLIYLLVVERIITSINALSGWTRYLPGQAQEALVGSTLTNQQLLSPWLGGLVLAGYALLLAAAGILTTTRRDIT
jgi:ABC-type transport system involved in multi-copper enzyme maturation permease subunit